MGLQATIQTLVGTAFDAIGDLKETVSYTHKGQEPDYDPTTGVVTTDSDTSTISVRAVIISAATAGTKGELPTALAEVARVGDQLALIPALDLQAEPTTNDELVWKDDTWVVKGFEIDPAAALWKVLIRRIGGGADGALVFHD